MIKRINWRQTFAIGAIGVLATVPVAPHAIMLEFSRDAPGTLAAPVEASVGLCLLVILLATISIRKRSRLPLLVLAAGIILYLFSLRFITFNAANAEVTEYLAGMPVRRVELQKFNDEIYCTSSSLFSLAFVSKTSGNKFETLRGIWPAYISDAEVASGTAALPSCSKDH